MTNDKLVQENDQKMTRKWPENDNQKDDKIEYQICRNSFEVILDWLNIGSKSFKDIKWLFLLKEWNWFSYWNLSDGDKYLKLENYQKIELSGNYRGKKYHEMGISCLEKV